MSIGRIFKLSVSEKATARVSARCWRVFPRNRRP